jgi:hypothetical protein
MVGVSRRKTESSDDSARSSNSGDEQSYKSRSTAPTEYSTRPSLKSSKGRSLGADVRRDEISEEFGNEDNPRISTETYASTLASEPELQEDQDAEYEVPDYHQERYYSDIVPATPADFSALFPSSRRLTIRHDDTIDGNLNLRIDTQVKTSGGRRQDIQLFHLRMHDLKNREFSLRRYCRDSGREVCHSVRKYQKPAAEQRPTFQRSLTNTISGAFRSKSSGQATTLSSLKRNDSGYGSIPGEQANKSSRPTTSERDTLKGTSVSLPTNTTKLEFSNYAQVDIKRRGAKSGKRYEFEYWGSQYAWKRSVKKDGTSSEISYYLKTGDGDHSIARIVPEVMSSNQINEESAKGGWIPPCSMWITDEKIINNATDASE